MSTKYPRNIVCPDRPYDFMCKGSGCNLLLWKLSNCFYCHHVDSVLDIDPEDKFTFLARRTKHGKWVWTYNTRPDTGYSKRWITLSDDDNTTEVKVATNVEHAYQDWILSTQIEQSLTENNIE